jgi:raffinose/stachyose/melibiose transport system permease protein
MMGLKIRNFVYELKWFVFAVPALLFYLVFFIIPSFSSVYYSFTNWDGLRAVFTGFDNYIEMFKDTVIVSSMKNTLFYTIAITIVQNSMGLLVAILMDSKKIKGVHVLRTIFFMPYIMSTLVLGYVWSFMLEPNLGALNNILQTLGLNFLILDWLGNPNVARCMIVVFTVWQCYGYNMVIYLAGLSSVPQEIHEAGDIDGAGGFSKFWHITFPLLAPSFTINMMLTTMGCLKLFDQIYALTGGGPGYTTDSIATTIYNLGFRSNSRWGYGAAMSIVLFVCILIISTFQVRFLRGREVEM